MDRIIVKSQEDVKALYYEAQGWVALYEGNLILKPPDTKPRMVRFTEFIPSWAGINLTTDEMLNWLDANLKEWLVVAEWTPSASVNLSKLYRLLFRGGAQ